jgi:metallo-beta-lactamase class B
MPSASRITAAALLGCAAIAIRPACAQAPSDSPSVTVRGQTYTPRSILARNMGSEQDQTTAFTPHKVVGNVYYVGTRTLSSYLITTPAGHILLNSTYERNVRTIAASVAQLGFAFADVKILLGTHAHGDHQEGDALVKELTGARVMAMEEDVPALERMRPGGKAHPIDRVLHDGEEVSLGGTTLVAHLTAGHTAGDTTWTTRAEEGGQSYSVVILGGMGVTAGQMLVNAAGLTPLAQAYMRSFKLLRSIPCDVPLGSHASMFNMAEKYARLGKGPNPFIDREGYLEELDARERVFNFRVDEQKKAAAKSF